MKAKKHLQIPSISIPLWWPGGPGWRRLARWLLPSPGNVLFTLLVVGGLLWATSAGALPFRAPALAGDSTTTISYQGRLADSAGNPVTTSGVGMQFRLYNTDTGVSPLWEESHTAVPVEDGLFHVLLGSTNPIPVSLLANNSTLWLGITVGADSEMTPREQIASVPYAMIASTVADGAVTSAKLANDLAVNGDFTVAGSIGIGTTNPGAKLEVKGHGDATLRITDAGDTYNDGDIQSQIVFYGRDSSGDSNAYETGAIRIVKSRPDGTGGTSLVFRTQQSGIRPNYNRMVIDHYGNVAIGYDNPGSARLAIDRPVGIGTTSPSEMLHVIGNILASGSKSAVVNTTHYGQRKLYALESPEVRFTDEGLARLVDGAAHVDLDPVFLETIEGEYLVHVTPYGDASLYVAEIGQDYFVVKARDGDPNVAFVWRLSAHRKGYAGVRLEKVTSEQLEVSPAVGQP